MSGLRTCTFAQRADFFGDGTGKENPRRERVGRAIRFALRDQQGGAEAGRAQPPRRCRVTHGGTARSAGVLPRGSASTDTDLARRQQKQLRELRQPVITASPAPHLSSPWVGAHYPPRRGACYRRLVERRDRTAHLKCISETKRCSGRRRCKEMEAWPS